MCLEKESTVQCLFTLLQNLNNSRYIGTAVHWIQIDVHGNSIIRWVVKDGMYQQLYGNQDRECWLSWAAWVNGHQAYVPWYETELQRLNGRWFMPMEYMAFGDIDGVIREHRALGIPIPEPFVWQCFEVLNAVVHALRAAPHWTPPHVIGRLLNLDIKPANVLLNRSRYPVTDPRNTFPSYVSLRALMFQVSERSQS